MGAKLWPGRGHRDAHRRWPSSTARYRGSHHRYRAACRDQ